MLSPVEIARHAPSPHNPNLLINGDFRVWQRGTSGFTTNGTFNADRWYSAGNQGTMEVSRVASDANAIAAHGFKYCWQRNQTVQAEATIGIVCQTRLENPMEFHNKDIALQFWAHESTKATKAWRAQLRVVHTGGSVVRRTVDFTTTQNTWGKHEVNFSAIDLTIYTFDANSYIGIEISEQVAPETFTLQLAGMKAEFGTVHTPFLARPIAQELALCQRYYQTSSRSNNIPTYVAVRYVAGKVQAQYPVTVPFRVKPTAVLTGNLIVKDGIDTDLLGLLEPVLYNPGESQVALIVSTSLTPDSDHACTATLAANSAITFDAEL